VREEVGGKTNEAKIKEVEVMFDGIAKGVRVGVETIA